jgi:aspartyl-tRNA(Asn)/glutamyl-tRNA(Gln) amidotransferase subunit B
MALEAVIGLECHIQLNTRSKMFCGCPAAFGAKPNSNVCPVCLGLPGALPSSNRAAVDAAIRLGLALGCAIRSESVFARKHYFYPDMPKNYQITQYDQPLCGGGGLPVRVGDALRRFELTRVHLEEDTGKSFHPERYGDRQISRVDFNRAGVPLLELVTRPVFREPAECAGFLQALRRLVRWLAISDGDMEKGQLRCDANVSLRPAGQEALGTKTELKNLNSIKGVEKGLTAEIARQRSVLASGGAIEQATLLYDADHDKLAVMRTKESAHDYRYFPEPDLPLLRVEAPWLAAAGGALPELPWDVEAKLVRDDGIPQDQAAIVSADRDHLQLYRNLVGTGLSKKTSANVIVNDVRKYENKYELTPAALEEKLPWKLLATLFLRVEQAQVTATGARGLLEEVFANGADPSTLFVSGGTAVSSAADLTPLVRAAIEENPGPVAQYLGGKTATLGFLVGQVMKKSGGQAVPQTVRELLEAELAKRSAGS